MTEAQSNEDVPVMPAETLEALRGSIAKWEGIVAGTVQNERADNCPLCRLFNPVCTGAAWADACTGCPVRAKTGHKFCAETPYERYEEMEGEIDEGENPDVGPATLKVLAVEEVEFLKSLLPGNAT